MRAGGGAGIRGVSRSPDPGIWTHFVGHPEGHAELPAPLYRYSVLSFGDGALLFVDFEFREGLLLPGPRPRERRPPDGWPPFLTLPRRGGGVDSP